MIWASGQVCKIYDTINIHISMFSQIPNILLRGHFFFMYMLLTGQRRYPCDRKGHSSVRVEGEFLCVCPFSSSSLQSSYVFVLFQLGLYKVPGAQVKMSGEDLKACVLEIQEVLVN